MSFTAMEKSRVYTGLAWLHWVSTGLSVLCLLVGAGDLSLRYPMPVVLWLLGNAALAAWRVGRLAAGCRGQMLLGALLGLVALASIPLLLWAYLANEDIIFRDATTTIRQHQTISWGGPKDEEIVTRHYRTTYLLFEEPVGPAEIKPALGYK